MAKKITTETFIEHARNVHHDKYDYSKVEYHKATERVCIICPVHGEFWQTPNAHLSGHGCPKCGNILNTLSKTYTTEEFINKAKEIHKNKYDYSNVVYQGDEIPVEIICPEHGSFTQKPGIHLRGCGCPECKREKSGKSQKLDINNVIDKGRTLYGDKYLFDKSQYVNYKTPMIITCPEHGDFKKTPSSFLHGHGCPECTKVTFNQEHKIPLENVIERANIVHNNKYDYSLLKYNNEKDKVLIICPDHGIFEQELDSHLRGTGCPKCAKVISRPEIEIVDYIKKLAPTLDIRTRDRNIIAPYEIDIFIPELKIGIEYNGLIWHSSKFKANHDLHIKKTMMAEAQGIRLLQIFEDEYINHKEIALSKISHILKLDNKMPKIMGRKCSIQEINWETAKDFLDKNHIQGAAPSTVYLGAYYNGELYGVMTFKQEKSKSHKWELNRFATDIHVTAIGLGGKLFKYFVRKYIPEEVKSFADRRWSTSIKDNIYTILGFQVNSFLPEDYRYYKQSDGVLRQHKFNFRKSILEKKYNIDIKNKTEDQITSELGYYKIWDCGLIKYIWKDGTTSKKND